MAPSSLSATIIGVVGCGTMGSGIAQLAALKGHRVLMVDLQPEFAATGKQRIEGYLQRMVAKGSLSAGQAATALARIDIGADLPALAPDGLILASCLSVSLMQLARLAPHPAALVGFGMLPPFKRSRLVELTTTIGTAPAARERAEALLQNLGKAVVWVHDTRELVQARVVCGLINEAAFAVQTGIASIEDIDMAMRLGTNYPDGPLSWADQIGLEQVLAVLEGLQYEHGERYLPCSLLRQKVRAGHLGVETGMGFYGYQAEG